MIGGVGEIDWSISLFLVMIGRSLGILERHFFITSVHGGTGACISWWFLPSIQEVSFEFD